MNLTFGIIISIGLNAFLVAGVVHEVKRPKPLAAEENVMPQAATKTVVVSRNAPASETNIVTLPPKPFHWSQLEAADYHKYIANLRAIKCPEATIQDIIYADVEKVLAKKFRAVNMKYKTNRDGTYGEYWKPDEEFLRAKLERDLEGRLIHAERRDLLASLLGPEAERQRRVRLGLPDDDGARYPFLTVDKLAKARDIWGYYDGLEAQARMKYQAYVGEEIKQEFHDIAIQRDAAIKNLLSSYEYNELLLRLSYVSGRVHNSLDKFVPTEQEFRSVFKVEYQQFLDLGPYAYAGSVDPEDTVTYNKKLDAQAKKETAIRAALGDDRYSDYALVSSPEYQRIYQAALAGGLPKQTALKAYDLRRAANTETTRIMSNAKLTMEQKQQALMTVNQSTASAMQTVMGEAAYKGYESSRAKMMQLEDRWEVPQKVIQR